MTIHEPEGPGPAFRLIAFIIPLAPLAADGPGTFASAEAVGLEIPDPAVP